MHNKQTALQSSSSSAVALHEESRCLILFASRFALLFRRVARWLQRGLTEDQKSCSRIRSLFFVLFLSLCRSWTLLLSCLHLTLSTLLTPLAKQQQQGCTGGRNDEEVEEDDRPQRIAQRAKGKRHKNSNNKNDGWYVSSRHWRWPFDWMGDEDFSSSVCLPACLRACPPQGNLTHFYFQPPNSNSSFQANFPVELSNTALCYANRTAHWTEPTRGLDLLITRKNRTEQWPGNCSTFSPWRRTQTHSLLLLLLNTQVDHRGDDNDRQPFNSNTIQRLCPTTCELQERSSTSQVDTSTNTVTRSLPGGCGTHWLPVMAGHGGESRGNQQLFYWP